MSRRVAILFLFLGLLGSSCSLDTPPASSSPSFVPEVNQIERSTEGYKLPSVKDQAIPEKSTVGSSAPRGYYKNVDGDLVPRPYNAPSIPAGASARCRDGTYSFSQNRRGTCSGHGGVAQWY